jgi:hypothetical protein
VIIIRHEYSASQSVLDRLDRALDILSAAQADLHTLVEHLVQPTPPPEPVSGIVALLGEETHH